MNLDPAYVTPQSGPAESALGGYARAVRSHWLFVTLTALVAVGAALFALSRREPTYEASAQILVTPIQAETFLGLDLVRNSGDPERTAQTAAGVLDSPEAARIAADAVGMTPGAVRAAVRVEPEGESNLLAVRATAHDPDLASRLANEFARGSIAARQRSLEQQIRSSLPRLQRRRKSLPEGDGTRQEVVEEISQLEAIRASGRDPTVALTRMATAAATPIGATPLIVLGLALIAGLVVGSVGAVLVELLNRNVRDEGELLTTYPLPILTRIPRLSRRRRTRGISPFSMMPSAREAFRTLRAQLEQRGRSQRTVMMASASAGDGKTTAAVSLAVALVDAEYLVVLLDFDLRRPDVATTLGIAPGGWSPRLTSNAALGDLLVEVAELPGLRVLPAREGDAALLEALIRELPELLAEAREMADFVVLDTAPLGEVSDALRIAPEIDDIVLVVRPGHTDRNSLIQVRDLLERAGARPTGLLLTGQTTSGRGRSQYYAYGSKRAAR